MTEKKFENRKKLNDIKNRRKIFKKVTYVP